MDIIHIYPKSFSFLSSLQKRELLLYHEALQSDDYIKFYRKNKNYKILDNSYYELREPIDYDKLIEMGIKMKVNEIVLPDKLNDVNWTLQATFANLHKYGKIYKQLNWKTAAVLQGKKMSDIRFLMKEYLANPHINVIMIPRKIKKINTYYEGRITVWLKLCEEFGKEIKAKNKEIHFLGANCFGDFYPPRSDMIRSMDTKLFTKTLLDGEKWESWEKNKLESHIKLSEIKYIQKKIINNYYKEV